ncbi:tryptophan-rich sensory protein [Brachybacterium sp. AOP43-C2-M15]|uniref:tryptophan-rich sensory protein n=1 Tax=Brachybacterium sp. AOP43-C2-M15 TaxID=3457661 RepID=UPI00403330D9
MSASAPRPSSTPGPAEHPSSLRRSLPQRSLLRRAVVTVSFLIAILGSAVGVGALGGEEISEAAGGLLAADATHLAPAGPAFSLWTLIYVGLGAFTLWQWRDRADERRLAEPAIASLLLNAAWILSIQAGAVGLSVVVILLLLAVLAELFRRLAARPPRSRLEHLVVDGTFGLYLGWVSVATCANIAAALKGAGFGGFGVPDLLAVGVIAAVVAVGVGLTVYGRAPVAAPLAMIWGLAWIAVGRATDAPDSPVVAIAAVVAAVLIAAAAVVQLLRRGPGARRIPAHRRATGGSGR